jgi:hypothetical protein
MYSAVIRPPRVAGARPSSRSDERNRRWPSISAAVIGAGAVRAGACAWAPANGAASARAAASCSGRRKFGIGDA